MAMFSTTIAALATLAVMLAPTAQALPVRHAPARDFFNDVIQGGVIRRQCFLRTLNTVVGIGLDGAPVYGAECIGSCPRHENCEWGCAPSDYTACNAPCFSGGEAECNAHEDYTGDKVCGWDSASGSCVGCNAFTDETTCSASPNCRWQSDGCHARGQTTSPTCDGRGNPCSGHSEDECPETSDGEKECQASSYKLALRFPRFATTTEAPQTSGPTLVTESRDLDRTADWELPIPERRHARGVAKDTATGDLRVNEPRCAALAEQAADLGTDVPVGGRVGDCVGPWLESGMLRLVRVPASCDCM